jgi:CRP-like cAMP-binding protein
MSSSSVVKPAALAEVRRAAQLMAGNSLLASMNAADRAALEPHLEEVQLTTREVLERPNFRISYVYFLTSGLASIVGTTKPHQRIEVGMVGNEGMTGLAIVLGHDHSTNETVIQADGTALRLPSTVLRRVLKSSPTMTNVILRYVHVFMMQASQTALANGRAKLSQRLARWLLMWHDRLQTPHLTVTHSFLALLLGVRRQGVTVALHELEGKRLIKGNRSQITVTDRAGLLALANGFYGVAESEYLKMTRNRAARRR